MSKFDVAGVTTVDAPAPARQDAAWTPTVQANVGVPLAQAAVQGGLAAIAALCGALALLVALHLLGISAPWYAYLLLLLGAVLVFVGVTARAYPERQAVIDDALYKRETAQGVDLNGDGVIGAPHPPVWSGNKPPAEDALLRERARMRLFVQALYDAGTTYNALRGAGFNSDADIRLRLVELQQGGILKLVKRGQRDTVELLLERTEALERLDRAKFMDD